MNDHEADDQMKRCLGNPLTPTAGAQTDSGTVRATRTILNATPFVWRDSATIPRLDWLYGHHLLRGAVSVTVAPSGLGKSSLTICEALAMVTGRPLLGTPVHRPLNVWLINLEDDPIPLEGRINAAMQHHGIHPNDIHGRLRFFDGGPDRVCLAEQRNGSTGVLDPALDEMAGFIEQHGIDVVILDPFVSFHEIDENNNGAIDKFVKALARLARRFNCAIEIVHHTHKLGGATATSESSRGASSLLAAARSGRVLNRLSPKERNEHGIGHDRSTYFTVDRDKANYAQTGREWRRIVSVRLANGETVGVVESWQPPPPPKASVEEILAVQKLVQEAWDAGSPPRDSDQAKEGWVGLLVAEALSLDPEKGKGRIKQLLRTWKGRGYLRIVKWTDEKGKDRPCLEVGKAPPVDLSTSAPSGGEGGEGGET